MQLLLQSNSSVDNTRRRDDLPRNLAVLASAAPVNTRQQNDLLHAGSAE
ncbi:hypothetical protein [Thiospirillum jenense]|uniref:Uncharacterized protein n=1 Tax=Thiospirillum jenense TaxID=1653858 RepID=A0A839HGW2_9GAMM|nr:hypothetical protein [Thiospirillum jenense]